MKNKLQYFEAFLLMYVACVALVYFAESIAFKNYGNLIVFFILLIWSMIVIFLKGMGYEK